MLSCFRTSFNVLNTSCVLGLVDSSVCIVLGWSVQSIQKRLQNSDEAEPLVRCGQHAMCGLSLTLEATASMAILGYIVSRPLHCVWFQTFRTVMLSILAQTPSLSGSEIAGRFVLGLAVLHINMLTMAYGCAYRI
jgi:hypothetical protein